MLHPDIKLPCGAEAFQDAETNEYSYRCKECFCIVGSVGMPRSCRELLEKERDERGNRLSIGGNCS